MGVSGRALQRSLGTACARPAPSVTTERHSSSSDTNRRESGLQLHSPNGAQTLFLVICEVSSVLGLRLEVLDQLLYMLSGFLKHLILRSIHLPGAQFQGSSY